LAKTKYPFAIVVGCSDSRVPPEIVFDQGLGDLFVCRIAGNVINDESLGSIEYAVDHLTNKERRK
jgi:carbonic anhydrase